MRRLFSGRIHKRPYVVSIIVLASFLLAGIFFILYLGVFGTESQLDRVRVSADSRGSAVYGLGMNLVNIPTANIVKGASFENSRHDQLFTVSEGSQDYAYLIRDEISEGKYTDGDFSGGSIRIMSMDEQGQMIQKLQADILDFQVNQLGVWKELGRIRNSGNYFVSSLESSDKISVAFFSDGMIISDITSNVPQTAEISIRGLITDTSAVSGRFNAVCDNGTIITSTDGKNFNSFSPDFAVSSQMNTVSSLGKVVVAAGDDGLLLNMTDGTISSITNESEKNLTASASDGNTMIVAGEDGTILSSSNGTLFRELSKTEMPVDARYVDWVSAAYGKGIFVLTGSSGQIAIGKYDQITQSYNFSYSEALSSSGEIIDAKSVMIDASGKIVLQNISGKMYLFVVENDTWKELSMQAGALPTAIENAPGGKIIIAQGANIYTTSLLTRVQFSETLSDTELRAGDMCYLSCVFPAAISGASANGEGLWQVFGDGTFTQVSEDAPPSGGDSSIIITGGEVPEKNQSHFISQVISTEGTNTFSPKTFYRLDVWLKQNGVKSGEVMAWISGDFDSVGTVFTDVGVGWRQYSFVFVLPAEACGENAGEIRINVGFSGVGEVYADKIYLGKDAYSADAVPEEYTDLICRAAPSYIRLSNLRLGKQGTLSDAYLWSIGNEGTYLDGLGEIQTYGCISLEESLKLVKLADSNPWLVIDSSSSVLQIDRMMEYLCGSISDSYGKIRIDNGTAVPWSRQFDRIVFEIDDSDLLFSTDMQKGAYVDYVIEAIKASPYYMDIKDVVIFLDGMQYDGGSMLSAADYHSSMLHIEHTYLSEEEKSVLPIEEILSGGYLDYFDLIPRITSKPLESSGEWINSQSVIIQSGSKGESKSSNVNDRISAAVYVNMLLADFGNHTTMVCIDLPTSNNPFDLSSDLLMMQPSVNNDSRGAGAENMRTLVNVFESLSGVAKGHSVAVSISPSLSSEAGDNFAEEDSGSELDGLISYAFGEDEMVSIIVSNISNQPRQFLIETDFSKTDMVVRRYSEEGVLLSQTKSGGRNGRYTLIPGQYIVANVSLPADG